MRSVVVRALAPGDDHHVRQVFCDTVLLGHSGTDSLQLLDQYASLCLDWFLTVGRTHAAIAVEESSIVGYALACPEPEAQARWARRRALSFATHVLWHLVTGRLNGSSRAFYRARLADARALWHGGSRPAQRMQVHLNVVSNSRSGAVAMALRDHLDDVARDLDLPGWYGEINAFEGQRERALERVGLRVVGSQPNRTLSVALGRPVNRLTVVRSLTTQP